MRRVFQVLLAVSLFMTAASEGWGASVPQSSAMAGVLSSIAGTAQLSRSEQILSYNVTAEIQEDSGLFIREDLTIMVTNDRIKKGIVRAFPVDYRDSKGRSRSVGFYVQSTSVDGQKMGWTETKEGRAVMVRMGDPRTTLAPGVHRFTLEYRATGELGFYENHDELYWNVTGNEWKFPILKASFAAKLPGKAPGEGFSAIQWYSGPFGSKAIDGARKNADGSVSTTAPLRVGEGLTVVYAWPKGLIAKPVPTALDRMEETLFDGAETIAQIILWGGAALSLFFAVGLLQNGLQNRRSAKTIIPLFRVPRGMTPALARYMQNMQSDNTCFSAELLNLAVAGELKIQELSKKSYRLLWQKKRNALNLEPLDREISQALFYDSERAGTALALGEENHSRFRAARDAMDVRLKSEGCGLFSINLTKVFGIYGALFISGLMVCILENWLHGGILEDTASLAGVVCSLSVPGFLWALIRSRGNAKKGFFRTVLFGGALVFFTMLSLSLSWAYGHVALGCVYAALLTSGVLFVSCSVRFTEAGRDAQSVVKGLRMYIATAEKDRLEMFNPPDDTPEVFERLLPYAVALDCVKTWVTRFDGILKAAQFRPDWYDGDELWREGHFAAFSAAKMASSLNGFASNFSKSLSSTMTAPGSSSGLSDNWGGGGDSGGSSGGGGGGGGGDGW